MEESIVSHHAKEDPACPLSMCLFFYGDVLLKRAQSQNKNVKRKEVPQSQVPRLRNITFLC